MPLEAQAPGEEAALAVEKVGTYVHGLDERIGGGVPPGSIVLVAGPAGSLKSTLVYRILHGEAKAKGLRGLMISLEQSRESLLRQMAGLGMEAEKAKGLNVLDLRALRKQVGADERGLDWFAALERQLARYKAEVGLDLLAVDSLNALYSLQSIESPRTEIFQFFEGLREMGATTFLISEMARDQRRFSVHDVEEFLADGIIHLRVREMESGMTTSVRRYIGVVKMRGSEHELDYYPLIIDRGQFEIVAD
jgi:circadian clock protein KaiC